MNCGAPLVEALPTQEGLAVAQIERGNPFLASEMPATANLGIQVASAGGVRTPMTSPGGNFWELPGFKLSMIAGALVTPTALIIAFTQFTDANGVTPQIVPWVLVALGIVAAWVVLSLMMLGPPQAGAPLRPYWGLLLGVIAGGTIGLLVLVVAVLAVMSAGLAADDRRRRRY